MKRYFAILVAMTQLLLGAELAQINLSHSSVTVDLDQNESPAILIRVSMPEGWYSYGEDPGQVGKPMVVSWSGTPKATGALEHPKTISKQEGSFSVNAIPGQGLWRLPIASSETVKGDLSVRYLVCKDICVPQRASLQLAFTGSQDARGLSPLQAILFAFLGGLILNIMPCVFPVLFLKVLSLVKSKDYSTTQRLQAGFGYATGILLSFLALALTLWALKSIGLRIGWGFHLQSAPFVMAMSGVFLGVTLHLSDKLEVPKWALEVAGKFSTSLSGLGSKHIFASNLNTGILATAVATPCTAPLMAPAIAYAFTQPLPTLIAIFLSLGVGMALPYILAVSIPGVASLLPKPGAWMEQAKHLLAIPMAASLIWLLWVLKQQVSWLNYLLFLAILTAFTLWSIHKTRPIPLKKIATTLILLTAIMASARYVWIDKAMPPNSTQTVLNQLKTLQSQNQTVLVDVTADWCITCKANELLVLNTNEIQRFFNANNVTLLTLDWTNYDDKITEYLESYNRNGVPLYVLYKPAQKPKVLPQVLTKDIVKEAIRN